MVASLSELGVKVVTCGRAPEPPKDLPKGVIWFSAVVAEEKDILRLGKALDQLGGKLDILVNNAGVQVEKTVADSTDQDWDMVMGVNAKAVFQLCRHFIPVMKASGGGSIINIGSISGHFSDPSMALYNASKAFVHGLTRSIAVDHGRDGIRCNAICPGWIMTGMADAAFALAKDPVKAEHDSKARHAVGRFGQPNDIAKAMVFLASDEAAFMTGQTMTVDGGLTAASPIRPELY
jgi:NAD(P)-dependent dehydrogenase (short-subunit alcohol dehydrogenase family)